MKPDETSHSASDIAIIGMSGRFPGAPDVESFWKNLVNGVESIAHFTDDELEFSVADPESLRAGVQFVKARAILEDVDRFDAAFFGIYPKDAETMDPQHRVFLECAWEAMENAGYDPERFPGLIGVFAGASLNSYLLYNLAHDREFIARIAGEYEVGEYQTVLGNDKDYLPTRVAYKLNLRGPAMAVQSACSTSLVAVCQAIQNLQSFQCDMALAGGVSISFPQKRDYRFTDEGMVAPDGHCRPFDASAQGTVFGNGAAIVLLKRLADAMTDGDNILAVIKGAAVNNDGAVKVGYTAPSADGQTEVIALAQAIAGINPESISCIETHGTGTPLGDPIEIAGLTRAFRAGTDKRSFCAITTAKGHVGHLETAAGVTGLIKTILSLQHRKIPPVLNFTAPNPRIDFAASPFYVNTELREWTSPPGVPRRAGVSSFGVGGTNAHVIVEEAAVLTPPSPARSHQLLVLSARSASALETASDNLAAYLEAHPEISLADAAFTLQAGRREFVHRRSLVAATGAEAAARLRTTDPRHVFTAQAPARPPALVFVFPGQGAQSLDMGRELYRDEPVFRAEVDRCAELLRPDLGLDLRHTIYPDDANRAHSEEQINQTWLTQPAIFVVEYALARLWISWGIQPSALVGHSIGEYVCAVLADSMTIEGALSLLAARARLMQALPAGSMLAVRLGATELQTLLPKGFSVAAINSPNLCTVSGPTPLLKTFRRELQDRTIASRFLETSHAFHSAMMDPLLDPFTALVEKTPRRAPQIPWVSTATGQWMTPEDLADPAYWARQLRQTVRFAEALGTVLQKDPATVLLEVGPGQSLTQLAAQHPNRTNATLSLASLGTGGPDRDLPALFSTLGRLWSAGLPPDWSAFHSPNSRRRIPLPSYPFERKRFWVEPPKQDRSSIQSGSPEATPPNLASVSSATTDIQSAIPVTAIPDNPADRLERLRARLRVLVKELSGIEISSDTVPFMELGFDSLFLTQASQVFQAKFGVKVAFRQMLDDLSTIATLAQYLADRIPAENDAPAPEHQAQPTSAPKSEGKPRSSGMRPVHPPSGRKGGGTADFGPKRFGPYRPIEKGAKGGLTDRQQACLDSLVERYVRKTAGSKRYTAENRPHFADPRAVSGFNANWKEMVYPIVSTRSKGSKIWDLDGNEYVDVTMGFGTYFFGHSPDWLMPALEKQLAAGIEIGPQSPLAGQVARLVCEFTGMERATFCNTGSEAVMAAMRLARMSTGRSRIVYFTGDYHGMFEEVLVRGSWVDGEYRAQPAAPGIPANLVENMLVLDYGAPESLEIIKAHADEIAAVMVEPVRARQPGFQPREFLHELRAITERCGAALIFDEVVTGFRCHPGGAQAYFGVQADLATYGKVIGAGIPIGVLAGRRKFMDALDGGAWNFGDDSVPEVGMTFFAGTFVRHPLAMAAAWRVLNYLKDEGPRLQLLMAERVGRFCRILNEHFEQIEMPIRLPHFGPMAVIEHAADLKFISLLWAHLRVKGIHAWENRVLYFTLAHTDEDFDQLIRAFKESVAELQDGGFLPEAPAEARAERAIDRAAPAFARCDTAPVTEAQREMFLATLLGDDANCVFNESCVLHLRGSLNQTALNKSVQHLFDRHPALRSTFSRDGATQIFHPPRPQPVTTTDWSTRSREEAGLEYEASAEGEMSAPFDLESGPLIRFHLFKLPERENRLILTAHHLVCDGWSTGMIVQDLSQIYSALVRDRVPMLPPPVSFADFARHQAEMRTGPEHEKAESYWLGQFSDGAPTLELPTDRPRPHVHRFAGNTISRPMNAELFAALKKATPRLGGTLFVTLFGSFGVLLHRLTGQEDMVIGISAAGQPTFGCSDLVGHCLNFLPVRVKPCGQLPFEDFARSVKQVILDAYDHQNYTYGALLQNLKLPRDPGRPPLISAMFNIDKSGFDLLSFEGLEFDVVNNPKRHVNFDLFFNLVQSETGLEVECEYNTDLFDRSTIERWLHHFETLLEAIVADPTRSVASIPLLSPSERERMLRSTDHPAPSRGSATIPIDGGATIHELFQIRAAQTPDRVALSCEGSSLSYRELNRRANLVARRLRQNGVGPETLVGLRADRTIDLIVALLGILKSGGAYLPIDLAYPPERVAFMLDDSRAAALVTHSSMLDSAPATGIDIICIDEILRDTAESEGNFNPEPLATPDHLAYAIYTSGTTGKPKGTLLTHRNVVRLFANTEHWFGFNEHDVWTMFHSVAFDFSVWEIWGALLYGGRLIVVPHELSRAPEEFYRRLAADGVTVLNQTPSAFRMLMAAEENTGPRKLKLRHVIFGGETLNLSDLRPWFARHGDDSPRLVNMYGITETTVHVTYRPLRKADLARSSLIGVPIPDLQLFILDPSGEPTPIGIAGEIFVGGPGLARGYLNRDALTRERFVPDHITGQPGARLYRSGDTARLLADGEIEYLGRIDQQVKIRGHRVELGEIESVLKQQPSVRDAVVTAHEADPGDNRIAAYVIARSGAAEPTDLRAQLRTHLPDYMVPSNFIFLDHFPLTANGKIDRKALPVPESTRNSLSPSFVAPTTDLELKISLVWKKSLKTEQVGLYDNFFDLGGNSVLLVGVHSELQTILQSNFPLVKLFQHPTLHSLAVYLSTVPDAFPASQPEAKQHALVAETHDVPDDHETGTI